MKGEVHVHSSVIKTLYSVLNRLNEKSQIVTPNFKNIDNNCEGLSPTTRDIPILPLENLATYPFSVFPLVVDLSHSMELIEEALKGDGIIGLMSIKDGSNNDPKSVTTYEMGTIATIHKGVRLPDNTLQVVVEGLERFRVEYWLKKKPYMCAHISIAPDVIETGQNLDALIRILRSLAQEVFSLSPHIPDELGDILRKIEDPRFLTYFVAVNLRLDVSKGQGILEMDSVNKKMQALISYLFQEKEALTLRKKIQSEASEEFAKSQREYYLRQQLKAIKKELGEAEDSQSITEAYMVKIDNANLPSEAKKEAQRELKRLNVMPPQAAEYSVIKDYLDWLLELPWTTLSEDQLDIEKARLVLDEDHYDLHEVKDRLLEYLAVRKLIKERGLENDERNKSAGRETMGTILCFTGPPGVGKTSLGKSIARALGRTFTHMSLGGIRDEAEIRGHRRTYVGAMPGRIIQAIKRIGTRNPVFILDEVDKIGSDWRGDPSSALLEVLDPAQNHAFRDHYLDVDFDLSDVMFITTANQLEKIPPPLRDRMEIIQLDGYTEYEKIHIAKDYLVPRQVERNGLHAEEIRFEKDALAKIVQNYTREAGVRNLERHIGAICRKGAVKVSSHELNHIEVTPEVVREYLKREKFESNLSEFIEIPGIATGLAVTDLGGDILFIEATRMKGKGKLTLTGQLGDVMQESARIALSFVRSKAGKVGVDPDLFEKIDLHVHVPEGAIPKDGPSAGVAMVVAIVSLFSGRPVKGDVGMTGEITLRGRVMKVGGIKMKVLAAHRAGLTTVILPKRNEQDLEELPEEMRSAMNFVMIENINEALKVALLPQRRMQNAIKTIDTKRHHWQQDMHLS